MAISRRWRSLNGGNLCSGMEMGLLSGLNLFSVRRWWCREPKDITPRLSSLGLVCLMGRSMVLVVVDGTSASLPSLPGVKGCSAREI